jgi:DNA-binding HxlR family transcriptional regulator
VELQGMQEIKKISDDSANLIAMFEDCLGCKWTVQILICISENINRPGILLKSNQGLSTKVLNECLGRLVDYKIIEKVTYSEIPPRVEYFLTAFGKEFIDVIFRIKDLQVRFGENLSN